MPELPPRITAWFAARNWRLRRHQAEMIDAARAGEDALLVAATGAGKTLAGFLASIAELIAEPDFDGLHTLYVSPLKALAVDVQRNLLEPIEEMGLDIRVETRTGDTPSDRKARQRVRPPHMLLTTPESLSLLLSYPESAAMFASLKTIIVDEIHAFAPTKRGDLLALAMSRLQVLAPALRRVALTATVRDPDGFRGWLSPDGDYEAVRLVRGEVGAKADIRILLPEDRVPWSGHSGRYAAKQVYEEIRDHRLTLVFCNTRSLAELIFQDIWAVNEDNLPIGVHHGSLGREARRKVESAMASGRLRGLVCTASLDLGVDWGDVDLVIQMGAPKGSSRLLQRIGRANHRLDEASEAIIVPGNRFEYLEAQAALDAVADGELDEDQWRPGSLDVLAQHLMACACAEPFSADAMYAEVRAAAPYALLTREMFDRVLAFIESGGYALRAYDKYRRITLGKDGLWRLSHPRFAKQHRLNAGIIVDAPVLDVRFRNGRKLGTVEEYFAFDLGARRHLLLLRYSAGGGGGQGRRPPRKGDHPPGARADLCRRADAADDEPREPCPPLPARAGGMAALPRRCAGVAGDAGPSAASCPPPTSSSSRPSRARAGTTWSPTVSRAGTRTSPLGMLITRRMETMGLSPIGFVSNDYALGCFSLKPVTDPRPLFSPDILEDELVEWVRSSNLLKRALPRGRRHRRPDRTPHPRQAQDRAAGHLLHGPHLRRAQEIRTRSHAAERRMGGREGPHDRHRPPGEPPRTRAQARWCTRR